MSYDLVFWRQALTKPYPSPRYAYETTLKQGTSELIGFKKLPRARITHTLMRVFSEWEKEGDDPGELRLLSKDRKKSILLEWYGDVAIVLCSGPLTGDEMSSVVDTFNRYYCALFDPQTNQRFVQPRSLPEKIGSILRKMLFIVLFKIKKIFATRS